MLTVAHIDEQKGLRGGEQQAAWLVKGLLEQHVRCMLVGRAGEDFLSMHREHAELKRVALPLRGEMDIASAWQLKQWVAREDIQILHAHTSHAHGLAVLARWLGAPAHVVVSRRVDFMPKKHFLNRWKYRQADRILCVSEKVSNTIHAFGLDEPRVRVVHSAVDPERALMPAVSRDSLGVAEDVPLLVSAGALVDHKDHGNLLRAVARVRSRHPNVQVCIAGEGSLRSAIERERNDLGLADCVSLLGHRRDAPGIIRAADVYVSSSWSEGLGTSILEALAAGIPVVATEAGGAREMVLPGITGHLAPCRNPDALAQAVCDSLDRREEALRMAENGRRHVEQHFSVPRMVEQTLAVYRELALLNHT